MVTIKLIEFFCFVKVLVCGLSLVSFVSRCISIELFCIV